MQLKGRVTRFSAFAGSGLAITKIGVVSFSCVARADSGHDPMEGDTLHLEVPSANEGELEAIVEANAWASSQEALEVASAFRKPHDQQQTETNSVVQHHENSVSFADEGMSEEARYFWYLQTIAAAVALQELNSIPMAELKEIMAHIAEFDAKYPKKAELIRKRVGKVVAAL